MTFQMLANVSTPPLRDMPRAFALAAASVATALTLLAAVATRSEPPAASLLLLSVLFASWYGGTLAGMFALLLSVGAFDYFYVGQMHLFGAHLAELPRLAAFVVAASCVIRLCASHHRAVSELKTANENLLETNERLTRVNEALERKSAQRETLNERLRWSEAFLREAQKISRTGSWRWSLSDGKLTWSDENFRIFGFYPGFETPARDAIFERIHEEDLDRLRDVVSRAVQAHRGFECEYRIRLPNRAIRYVRGVGRPIQWENGTPVEYIGTTVDITRQRQTEELLRQSEAEFRSLAENLPDGIIRYDTACNRLYVNPAHARHSGIPGESAIRMPIDYGWAGEIPAEDYRAMILDVMRTGTPRQIVSRWRAHGSGAAPVHLAVHVVPERNAEGETVGALAISRNITALKETERQLEESRQLLRRLSDRNETVREEERKHLARELHDDLAQYLLAIRMNLSVLGSEFGAQVPGLQARTVSMIGSVDTAIKSVRNVIASLRPAVLDMGVLPGLEWLVSDFLARTETPCELDIRVPEVKLGDKAEMTFFRVAQESLRNVARHAQATEVRVVFRHADGPRADDAGGRERVGAYVLEVEDNGVGFDPSVQRPRCFGLMGIQERVLMLGGTLEIASAPGVGTTIRAVIPHPMHE
ncbi:PAS domain S-box protein [Cupriavidus plantarum]|uniref:PAS domain S-box protein n=1 Tax=Cupriavidus plantarum TaxID=942865 RepID=UPI000E282B31|nr:PAS domain S-box protein [Cupriavidus plantarum]NYI01765.1 PAS domain S-box-containing protein [Cupriavidus plantarum]REE91077.1 PAS domain S-box-containing protein [Cupriavidus plantarum]